MTGKRRGRGEGSVEQLPDGKFKAWVSAGKKSVKVRDADGNDRSEVKRLRLSKVCDTKREALAWLRDQLAARDQGRLVEPTKMPAGVWLDNWLTAKRGTVEPGTWEWYSNAAEKYIKPKIGHLRLCDLRPHHVEQMLGELAAAGVSAYGRRKAMTTLRSALKAAVDGGYLYLNAATKAQKPKAVEREMTCWTREQATAFLAAAASDRLHAFYALSLDAGCRQGEALGAHWPDFDLQRGTFFVQRSLEEIKGLFRVKPPKTKKGKRLVYLAPRTVEALRRHRERMRTEGRDADGGAVFVNADGGFISKSNLFNRSWRRVLKRAGVPTIRPGDMRHTSATLLLAAGAGVKMVSERLGHEDIQTTLKFYVHVLPSQQEEAARIVQQLYEPAKATNGTA